MMDPDIVNMTLNEYLMYEGRHRDLARNYTSRKSVAPVRNSDPDEEDKEYGWLPCLLLYFQTPQPCTKFNSMPHNVKIEVDTNSMTLYEYDLYMAMQCSMKSDDIDNINDSTAREKEEVHEEEVKIDENYDVDHSNTKEALQ
ncbi:hypothetical protein Tco_0509533 [Tanacetum coccineum]